MSQVTGVSVAGIGARCNTTNEVSYGVAVGGLAAALFGAVDAAVIAFWGRGIPWILPPMIIASYLVLGWVIGGLLAGVTGLLATPNRGAESRESSRAAVRTACLAASFAIAVTVFVERLLHGHQAGFGQRFGSLAIVAGLAISAFGIVLATRMPAPRRSSELFTWPIICTALFCVLWKPLNDLYQAPLFSITGLLANACYVAAGTGLFLVGRRVARRLPPLIRVETTHQCLFSTVGTSLVGIAIASGVLWTLRQKPIDIPYRLPAAGFTTKTNKMPNVVLIVMDTTRADHLSVYGYERDTTPNLAALAEEAVLYTQAIAPSSWTLPSHASLFTGLLPTEHAAHHHLPQSDNGEVEVRGLGEEYTTLAEVLSDHGYNTAAVIGNTAVVTRDLGFSQGFFYFDDRERHILASVQPRALSPALWLTRFYQKYVERSKSFKYGGWQFRYFWRYADKINASVFAWLDRRVDAPFFLFVNYMDPHDPYRPHPEFDDRLNNKFVPDDATDRSVSIHNSPGPFPFDQEKEMANYDAEIAFVDDQIGALFDKLKADGQYDQSLIIVTSDHGEAFGEHGFFGHNNTLYQEEIRVPLIIRYPGGAGRGVNDEITSLASVMPMILSHLGIEISSRRIESDESRKCQVLAELRTGNTPGKPRSGWIMRALYTPDDIKVITGLTSGGGVEVYDLNRDPYETEDLSGRRQDLAHWGEAWLDTWAAGAETRQIESGKSFRLSEELRKKLSALGYLN